MRAPPKANHQPNHPGSGRATQASVPFEPRLRLCWVRRTRLQCDALLRERGALLAQRGAVLPERTALPPEPFRQNAERFHEADQHVETEEPYENELRLTVLPDDRARANREHDEQSCAGVEPQIFERAKAEA